MHSSSSQQVGLQSITVLPGIVRPGVDAAVPAGSEEPDFGFQPDNPAAGRHISFIFFAHRGAKITKTAGITIPTVNY
jgi:hypothetical protein